MRDSGDKKREKRGGERFRVEVTEKIDRRLRRKDERSAWFWFGMFGMVGWAVAVPTALGALIGYWIDRRWPSRTSWTLTLLFAGLVTGCLMAWYWVRRESEGD